MLVVAPYPERSLSCFLGLGNGNFTSSSISPLPTGTSPAYITNADFDNDFKIDLIIANNSGDLKIAYGTGSGTFTSFQGLIANQGQALTSVICVDLNGDGYRDIAATNIGANCVAVYLGTNAGGVNFVSNFSIGAGAPSSITAADLNNDGIPDLAVNKFNAGKISVLIGNGGGNFGPPIDFVVLNTPTAIENGDFNGDGRTDIAVANKGSAVCSILLNEVPPTIVVSGNTGICSGSSTTLTASGASSYVWSSNANSSTDSTVTVSPSTNTTYTVYAKDPLGCIFNPGTSVLVSVSSSPNVSFVSPSPACDSTCLMFSNTSTNATSWSWSFPGGNPNFSTQQNPTVCFPSTPPGVALKSYFITLKASNSGCVDSITSQFLVVAKNKITSVSTNPAACGSCNGLFAASIANSSPYTSYNVTGPGFYTSNGAANQQNMPFFNLCAGVYNYHLSGYNNTCPAVDTSITVGTSSNAHFNYTVTNNTVAFSMAQSSCTSGGFLWDYGNGMTGSIATNPSVTYPTSGTYTACLQCISSGCSVCTDITVPGNYNGSTLHIGINEVESDIGMIISPNPFGLQTTITFAKEQTNTEVKITDILGKEIKTLAFTGTELVLNKEQMKSGIYFLNIFLNKRYVLSRKLIVE
jgi:PKD repeat protein